MIKKILNQNILLNVLIAITLIGISVIVYYFLRFDVFVGDDIWQMFFINPFWDEFTHPDHGRYLAWMQIKLIGSSIPMMLKIHPQDFAPTVAAILKAINISLLCLIVSSFMFINKKKNFTFPILLLFVFYYFYSLSVKYNINEIVNDSPHYGYLFSFIIYALFWLMLINHYVKGEKLGRKYILPYCIIASLAGLNDAFTTQILFSLLCLGGFIFIDSKLKKMTPQETDNSVSTKLSEKILNIIYIPAFFLSVALSYYGVWADKHVVGFIQPSSSISNFIMDMAKLLHEFIFAYIKSIFTDHIIQYILIVILITAVYFLYRQKEQWKKIIFAALSMILGYCIFFFGLIIGGKNTFYVAGKFWIDHADLQLGLVMNLLLVTLLLLGYVLKAVESNKKIYYILTFTILASMIFQMSSKDPYQNYIINCSLQKDARSELYKAEKMYLFYALKNQPIILSNKVLANPYIASNFYVGTRPQMPEKQLRLLEKFETERGRPEMNNYEYSVNKIAKITFSDNFYNTRYIPSMYKKVKPEPYKFIRDKEALKLFYNAGGTFRPGEIDKAVFQNLYNYDFILNKKSS